MTAAFEAKKVYKYFGDVKAVDGISLSAEVGTIFGLLGPNGAGKTTLVRMLATLLEPDKGELKVLDTDVQKEPAAVRRLIGLAGQFAAVDEYLTGEENLNMVGRLYGLSRSEAQSRTKKILKQLALTDAAKRLVKTYSGGMRRRLDLGASLVGHPQILFLDEPTTGLDPKTRMDLWQTIRELVQDEGTSILLTTQYLEEADELASRIGVIDRGKVIAEGTSQQLKAKLGGDVVQFELTSADLLEKAQSAVRPIAKKKPLFDEATKMVTVPVGSNGAQSLLAIVRELDKAKIEPVSLSLHEPSLDDVFLTLTGETAAEHAKPVPTRKGR